MFKKIKNFLFKDYSTDIALRYLPIVDIIKKNNLENSKILEVGSGDLGITTYLKKRVTGVDIKFSNNDEGLLEKIKIDGEHFPFKDNNFDLVISVDNLEHIPSGKRQNFIRETLRVARNVIIFVVPCGREAYEQDKRLDEFFYKINKYQDKFLGEHLQNGLPEAGEIVEMLRVASVDLNKRIKITSKKLLNLKLRKFFMKCKISPNPILKTIYYLFIMFIPFRELFNFGSCYRELFFVEIN